MNRVGVTIAIINGVKFNQKLFFPVNTNTTDRLKDIGHF